jgi:hypothetical protein
MFVISDGGFRESEQIRDWLLTLPPSIVAPAAVAIASRSALRALVLVSKRHYLETRSEHSERLSIFRASAISRFALRFPTREVGGAASAAYAFVGANTAASHAAITARVACHFSSAANNIVSTSSSYAARDFINDAIKATRDEYRHNSGGMFTLSVHAREEALETGKEFWRAVSYDAKAIEQFNDPRALSNSKLWLGDTPDVWRQLNRRFQTKLSTLDYSSAEQSDNWMVWVDWYNSVVDGKNSFDLPTAVADTLDQRIALGDGREDFWDREPGAINREIAGWVEDARRLARTLPQTSTPNDPEAISQRPAAFSFLVDGARIEAVPLTSIPGANALSSEIRAETLQKIAATRARLALTQTPHSVLQTLDRLQAAMGTSLADVQSGVLLMRCRALEADYATFQPEDRRIEMSSDALSMIRDLVESLADFRATLPELVKLEAARLALGLLESDAVAAYRPSLELVGIAKLSSIAGKSAIDALETAVPDISETQRVIDNSQNEGVVAEAIEKRAQLVGLHLQVTRNFSAAVLKLKLMASNAAREASDHAYKGAMSGIEKSAEAAAIAAAATLASAIAGPLAAIALVVASFKPLAQKAQEVDSPQSPDIPIEI